ncbi:MAG: circularly permuted type 2 ATP-grasp protein [Coriobacteriales bacterium]|nr:circularly permuted type 2 ATP-grasp protein [Coriobacteriales bacterium]
MESLVSHAARINDQLARYGVKFGIYKNGVFNERLFPFDAIARVIPADEWRKLERGLVQRVDALNAFLKDVYGAQEIIHDNVVPEDFVFSAPGFLTACIKTMPPKGIYSHISGIDLVQSREGEWFVLEDNLRVPSGASYPLIARALCRRCSPDTYRKSGIVDNRGYGAMLREVMDNVNCGGINVIFTPGRYNAAYFEHSFLAEQTGAVLAEAGDLYVENERVYYRSFGKDQRVGAIYRRISDEYLDPTTFLPESVIGIPNLMSAYRAGNVAIINAPGNGAADDKGLYYFVPKMVEYYLGEKPLLHNAPTYLPFYPDDMAYVMDNFEHLVIKDTAEAGGYGVVFAANLSEEKRAALRRNVQENPRRWIAQEVVDFTELPVHRAEGNVLRKADLRVFVLTGHETKVWPSGLTRYSQEAGNAIVNSSQGGGFKDTWILSH